MTDAELHALLARLAAADATLETPARVERAVLAEYRETLARSAAVREARRWMWTVAAAAVIAALFAMVRRPPVGEPDGAAGQEAFLPLGDDGDSEVLADLEAVHVLRVEMPRTALAGFGYSGTGLPTEAGSLVRADLLVGNDGIARGIRFVP